MFFDITPDKQTHTTKESQHQTDCEYPCDYSCINIHKAPPAFSMYTGYADALIGILIRVNEGASDLARLFIAFLFAFT